MSPPQSRETKGIGHGRNFSHQFARGLRPLRGTFGQHFFQQPDDLSRKFRAEEPRIGGILAAVPAELLQRGAVRKWRAAGAHILGRASERVDIAPRVRHPGFAVLRGRDIVNCPQRDSPRGQIVA